MLSAGLFPHEHSRDVRHDQPTENQTDDEPFPIDVQCSSLTDPDIDSPESLANQDKKQESDDDDCP